MKTNCPNPKPTQRGSGLLVTIFMTGIALATLAGALAWSMSSTRLNERASQHARSVAAAEAVTETVMGKIASDFKAGGAKLVINNSNTYKKIVLNATNAGNWSSWEFNNAKGASGRTYVELGTFDNYTELNSTYSNLMGFVCPVTIISNARLTNTVQDVVGAVKQTIQLANIPIFQFALFSSGDMEISCGQPFKVTGKVHANGMLYVEPDDVLTFLSDVTCGQTNLFSRHPLDPRGPVPGGSVIYVDPTLKRDGLPALTLPIGTNNSPAAIREILQPPPSSGIDDPLVADQRYYNLSDLLITVDASGITATTGIPYGQDKAVPKAQLTTFASITNSFFDAREEKLVRPLDLNIKSLAAWAALRKAWFGGRPLSSVYVLDTRVLPANELAAVRVRNGTNLPSGGLTVSTARPLYVLGHYNQTNVSNLGTSNTSTTLPASLVADSITILSENWLDANSTNSSRSALPTTVNAALLTGVVETTKDHYSGGMENFPRFLEQWGSGNILTYNGSMVRMFPSLYATNYWGKSDVYDPPARNWAYDINFNEAAKLPPLTPSLQRVFRGRWTTMAPGSLTEAALNF